jgi:hypothetical protein
VYIVGEPIEQGTSQSLRPKNFCPFLEGPVRGDQGRATFVALAEHFEEELGTRLGERHEAQLIDDQQFVAGDLLRTYLLFVAFATVIIGHTRKGISA